MSDAEWIVELRDGTEVDARQASAEWQVLQREFRNRPGEIIALFAIANGEEGQISKELREGFFTDSDELHPLIRALLLNAVVRQQESFQFRSPFADSERSEHILRTIEDNVNVIAPQLFRRAKDGRDESGPSR